jgi:L-lactate dehydrogenase (cytochrome)
VAKVAEILRADVVRTMQLLGVTKVDELGPQHVRLR